MFLSPLFLIGTLFAGVPLVIHLMHRRHTHVIRWPSLRFLVAANRRTARRRQVQEMLLLAMRMAILGLLALALARPVIRAAATSGAGVRTAAVIVLDNSMSMSIRTGESTAFARAKLAAEEILRLTPAGSRLALRFADGTEPPTAHALSPNREAVVTALRAAAAGEARGDLGARVSEAVRDARRSGVPAPEVHVLTDLQTAAFGGAARAGGERGRPVSVVFVDCGVRDARNAAISSAAVRARRFVAGAPFGVDVRLRSFVTRGGEKAGREKKAAPAARLKVVLEFDGAARAERLVKLAPGGTVGFAFQAAFDRAGELTGSVRLSPADALPADDVRHFRVHLADRVPVLVIDHGKSSLESARGAFYIEAALDPLGDGRGEAGAEAGGESGEGAKLARRGGLARSPLVPQAMTPADVADLTPREVFRISQVAILTGLGPIEKAEAALWVEFVRRGGSIIIFPSSRVGLEGTGGLEEAARAFEAAAGEPFLPAEIGPASGDAEARTRPLRIAVDRIDFRHAEALSPFRELEETLRAVSVWRAYGLRPRHSTGGRVILPLREEGTAAGSSPAAFLVARRFGESGGEVHVFAVPATPRWSDFPARSLFLPLVHQLVYQATAPREEERSFLVGSKPRISLPSELAGRSVRFVEPGGRSTALAVRGASPDEEGKGAGSEGKATLDLPRLLRAGVYRLESEELPGGHIALVANTDPEESDTARVGEARLRELYGDLAARDPVVIRGREGLPKLIARMRKGLELWDLFFATVLSIALFESFFSNRMAAGAKRASGAAEGVQT